MKYFNTVGVTKPGKHYFLPKRLDWELLTDFIEKEYYFVLHAPRQSGKTTAIIEFVKHLNEEGKYTALYISIESARVAVNNVKRAMEIAINQFFHEISDYLSTETAALSFLKNIISEDKYSEETLYTFLHFWASESKKPLILFFDEFDVLAGDSLITILTQIRTGYSKRPKHFPQTICLIGIRDLRDYRTTTKTQEELGVLYSPFNVKAESLVLSNFSQQEVRTLYLQHTQETGQKFADDAINYAFDQTQGQAWLVNALAYQACFRDVKDRSVTITQEILERAKETLIGRRDTHLDSLTSRLKEARVATIVDAILNSQTMLPELPQDDIQYVIDLGLIARRDKILSIANPIYQEIIPKELSLSTQERIQEDAALYQNTDGSINTQKLMGAFQEFYRENADIWILAQKTYPESAPHLIFMAFLQRIINGGGSIHREYALGRKRVDLLIKWPAIGLSQQRIVIELKVYKDETTISTGLIQTKNYMQTCNASEGHLVVFDRRKKKTWDEKIYKKELNGISIWGL